MFFAGASMRSLKLLTSATLLVLALAATSRADNLVINGGFETGDFSNWVQSGDTSCTAVFASGIDLQTTACGYGSATSAIVNSGNYAAYLGPTISNGFLTQNLATTAGVGYTLTFWLASLGNPPTGNTPNDFNVSWDGSQIYSATNLGAFGFTQFSFNVVASTASTALVIGGFENQNSYFALDDVSVSTSLNGSNPPPAPTPEPGTVMLLGTGFAGIAGLTRRKWRL
jgi:hypothetical protein